MASKHLGYWANLAWWGVLWAVVTFLVILLASAFLDRGCATTKSIGAIMFQQAPAGIAIVPAVVDQRVCVRSTEIELKPSPEPPTTPEPGSTTPERKA